MFQSTRPHGARPQLAGMEWVSVFVSIHAPAWGATNRQTLWLTNGLFQSTRPHGARQGECYKDITWGKFQSTRPHGARHARSRHTCLPVQVSIHAPAWGATLHKMTKHEPNEFQSTRPHGARLTTGSIEAMRSTVSIHAPAWGATSR